MSVVLQHCQGQKRHSHTTPVTLHPYPSRLSLTCIPKRVGGILSQTVLQSPLISSIHYFGTPLSITAQYPSVKEQITHISHGNIVPALWKGSAPGANIKHWERSPQQGTAHEVFSQWALRGHRQGYSTVLQMGYTKRCALVSSCLDTLLAVKYRIPLNKMEFLFHSTNVRSKCSRVQVYECCSLH